MERLIGRKKIEEIRNSLRVETFKLYPQNVTLENKEIGEVPNFRVKTLSEGKSTEKFIMNDEYIKDLLCENPLFLTFLSFTNEYCPVARFELIKDNDFVRDIFTASFGNISVSIHFKNHRITNMSTRDISNGKKSMETEVISFHNMLKDETVKASMEYEILDKALRKQYNIQ